MKTVEKEINMKTKKIIALVCVLSMITLAVPQNTDGDFNMCSEQRVLADLDENVYRYQELEDGTVEITGYSGEDTVLTIPDEINGKRVTSIGNWAFEACSGLTKITIPRGVTSIEEGAFLRCYGLNEITIPESVTSIGAWAFNQCSDLTGITIPQECSVYN